MNKPAYIEPDVIVVCTVVKGAVWVLEVGHSPQSVYVVVVGKRGQDLPLFGASLLSLAIRHLVLVIGENPGRGRDGGVAAGHCKCCTMLK